MQHVEIGVIGGTGLYFLIEGAKKIDVENRYGKPSDLFSIGKINGAEAAFLPRHGGRHSMPPHRVPYKANMEGFSLLGAKRILATNAVGSLAREYEPGDIVFFDQFVNMTHGRDDTFFHEEKVVHVSTAEPYCPELRRIASGVAEEQGIKYHSKGTVVVVNGPRFSTRAESRFFSMQGFQLINMTQYPEVVLAREKGMCYLGIGIVTDYDAGLEGTDIKPASLKEVNEMFASNIDKVKRLISEIAPKIPKERSTCQCGSALDEAVNK